MTLISFAQVEEYLSLLSTSSQSHDGDRIAYMKQILEIFGDPQNKVPAIHIAGTSGKGSTAYYASSLLSESGYTVGLLVSPHVNSIAERTQINSQLLSEEDYCRHINVFIDLLNARQIKLTYLEFLTVFAYWLFARCAVDYVVIEVGIGGRLDMTNVMDRTDKVAVITDIGLDHTELLGDTIEKIANEKAGIIADGNDVVMYRQEKEVMRVISTVIAAQLQTTSLYLDPASATVETPPSLPSYQRRNMRLAYEAVNRRLERDHHSILHSSLLEKVAKNVIPGRFEMIQSQQTTIILDAAHNPQKIRALTEALGQTFFRTPVIFVTAFGENKTATVIDSLKILRGISHAIITTEFTVAGMNHGSIASGALKNIAQEAGFLPVGTYVDPHVALNHSLLWARQYDGIVVVTGSFYLVSVLRQGLLSATI